MKIFRLLKIQNKKGFSLMEILIVLAIMAILGTLTFMSLSKASPEKMLQKESAIILSQINEARLKTLSGTKNTEYGIHFASSSITVFEGKVFPSATSTVYTLSNPISISQISLTGNVTHFYFKKLTGEPTATGTITIRNNNGSTTKVLNITESGIIQ
jgi:prepilin-type N-terminal cleavage/methylation domain-containing protein